MLLSLTSNAPFFMLDFLSVKIKEANHIRLWLVYSPMLPPTKQNLTIPPYH